MRLTKSTIALMTELVLTVNLSDGWSMVEDSSHNAKTQVRQGISNLVMFLQELEVSQPVITLSHPPLTVT